MGSKFVVTLTCGHPQTSYFKTARAGNKEREFWCDPCKKYRGRDETIDPRKVTFR